MINRILYINAVLYSNDVNIKRFMSRIYYTRALLNLELRGKINIVLFTDKNIFCNTEM